MVYNSSIAIKIACNRFFIGAEQHNNPDEQPGGTTSLLYTIIFMCRLRRQSNVSYYCF